MAAIIDTPEKIARFQLVVWRGAVKLEKLGMKRRGKSCVSIVRQHFGMKKTASFDEVLERLNRELEDA